MTFSKTTTLSTCAANQKHHPMWSHTGPLDHEVHAHDAWQIFGQHHTSLLSLCLKTSRWTFLLLKSTFPCRNPIGRNHICPSRFLNVRNSVLDSKFLKSTLIWSNFETAQHLTFKVHKTCFLNSKSCRNSSFTSKRAHMCSLIVIMTSLAIS